MRSNSAETSVVGADLFDPAERLANKLPTNENEPGPVIVELNLDYAGGVTNARERFLRLYQQEIRRVDEHRQPPIDLTNVYLHCHLTIAEIQRIVRRDRAARSRDRRCIHYVSMDYLVQRLVDRSAATIKADAARQIYDAAGDGIVWAVLDSGIDGNHPHFGTYCSLSDVVADLHSDFTSGPRHSLASNDSARGALMDEAGHGTHVAGIIAGALPNRRAGRRRVPHLVAEHFPVGELLQTSIESLNLARVAAHEHAIEEFTEIEDVEIRRVADPSRLSGMAPRCKLVSLKVLNEDGEGRTSVVMMALRYIRNVNETGTSLKIHGANMSLGYPYNAKAFACGQGPLCVEVDQLVRSGVVVVAAAGNSGYGEVAARGGRIDSGLPVTINDPGNAALAITVGSTHRDSPYTYGVSFFSSKGPTTDGRMKPELVAPGERITSCATGRKLEEVRVALGGQVPADAASYVDDSGTSMAAPHVSGAIAAFLSVHREFIGRPEEVKRIFLKTATSLGREVHFQGHGLVDLVRALNSV